MLAGPILVDPVVHDLIGSRFARWTDIDVEFNGHPFTVGGQGFAAMSRKKLLEILQHWVDELGVTVHHRSEAPDREELREQYDLVLLASDRPNSVIRTKYADVFKPNLDRRKNKNIWFGTDLVFETFQFYVKQTEGGTMQIHGYPYSETGSRFIVEMHEDVWRRTASRRRKTSCSLRASRTILPLSASRTFSSRSFEAERSSPTTPAGSTSTPSATSGGTTAMWCCWVTRPTPLNSPSDQAPSWPWRMPSSSQRACMRTPRCGARYQMPREATRADIDYMVAESEK